ncbi:conserved Plasmodium protein, unknown function [Plasmodium gallinaceum]|uniref:WD repeat-containing protein n=1 Tax=Plasmodium gallinaceum TaxID=5849 RepID=A0A1J1GMI3_PLAGA|nr:conserved Plasmodium protein, unknown function [Plasmodium gallinaceum]CRG93646.1 conserved Plasmodium protein, unknown function [Plasmodium gallinaceum]
MNLQEIDEKIVLEGNYVRNPFYSNNVKIKTSNIVNSIEGIENKANFLSLSENVISKIRSDSAEIIKKEGEILDVNSRNVCYALKNGKFRLINQNGINTTRIKLLYENEVLYVSFNKENGNYLLLLDNKGHLYIYKINEFKVELVLCLNFPSYEKNPTTNLKEIKNTLKSDFPKKASWLPKSDKFFITGHNNCLYIWNISLLTNAMIMNKLKDKIDVNDKLISVCAITLSFEQILHKYNYLFNEDFKSTEDLHDKIILNTYSLSLNGKYLFALIKNYYSVIWNVERNNHFIKFTLVGLCSLKNELLKIRKQLNINTYNNNNNIEISSVHILNTFFQSSEDGINQSNYYLLVFHSYSCISVFPFKNNIDVSENFCESIDILNDSSIQNIYVQNGIDIENIELFVDPSEFFVFFNLSYKIPNKDKGDINKSLIFVLEVFNKKRLDFNIHPKFINLPNKSILPLCSIRLLKINDCLKFAKVLNVSVSSSSLNIINLFLFAIIFNSSKKSVSVQSFSAPIPLLMGDVCNNKEASFPNNDNICDNIDKGLKNCDIKNIYENFYDNLNNKYDLENSTNIHKREETDQNILNNSNNKEFLNILKNKKNKDTELVKMYDDMIQKGNLLENISYVPITSEENIILNDFKRNEYINDDNINKSNNNTINRNPHILQELINNEENNVDMREKLKVLLNNREDILNKNNNSINYIENKEISRILSGVNNDGIEVLKKIENKDVKYFNDINDKEESSRNANNALCDIILNNKKKESKEEINSRNDMPENNDLEQFLKYSLNEIKKNYSSVDEQIVRKNDDINITHLNKNEFSENVPPKKMNINLFYNNNKVVNHENIENFKNEKEKEENSKIPFSETKQIVDLIFSDNAEQKTINENENDIKKNMDYNSNIDIIMSNHKDALKKFMEFEEDNEEESEHQEEKKAYVSEYLEKKRELQKDDEYKEYEIEEEEEGEGEEGEGEEEEEYEVKKEDEKEGVNNNNNEEKVKDNKKLNVIFEDKNDWKNIEKKKYNNLKDDEGERDKEEEEKSNYKNNEIFEQKENNLNSFLHQLGFFRNNKSNECNNNLDEKNKNEFYKDNSIFINELKVNESNIEEESVNQNDEIYKENKKSKNNLNNVEINTSTNKEDDIIVTNPINDTNNTINIYRRKKQDNKRKDIIDEKFEGEKISIDIPDDLMKKMCEEIYKNISVGISQIICEELKDKNILSGISSTICNKINKDINEENKYADDKIYKQMGSIITNYNKKINEMKEEIMNLKNYNKNINVKLISMNNNLSKIYEAIKNKSYLKNQKDNTYEIKLERILNEINGFKKYMNTMMSKFSENLVNTCEDMKNYFSKTIRGNNDNLKRIILQDLNNKIEEMKHIDLKNNAFNKELVEFFNNGHQSALKKIMPSVISSEIQIQFAKSVVPGMREAYNTGFQSIKESLNALLLENKNWLSKELYGIEKVIYEKSKKNNEDILLCVNNKMEELEKEIKIYTYNINQQINYLHDDINVLSKSPLQLNDQNKSIDGNNLDNESSNNNAIKKNNSNSSIVELKKNNDYNSHQENDPSDIIIKGRINHLLSEHEYDQAFTLALSIDIEKNTNAYWILQLCYRFHSNLLLDDNLPISQPALLGISKILCESLTKSSELSLEEADFRIKWIRECLLQLDVNHSDLIKTNAFMFIQNMLNHICSFSYDIENKIRKANENTTNFYKNVDLKNNLLLSTDSITNENVNHILCLNEVESLNNKDLHLISKQNNHYDKNMLLILQDKLIQIRKLLKRIIKNLSKKDNV